MNDEEKEIELIEMDEEDLKAQRKSNIRKIVYFSVLILLIVACIIVVVVLKNK